MMEDRLADNSYAAVREYRQSRKEYCEENKF